MVYFCVAFIVPMATGEQTLGRIKDTFRPSGAFRKSIWDKRTIRTTSTKLVAVSKQNSEILVRTVPNTWAGKDWDGVKLPTKSLNPAPNQWRHQTVRTIDKPDDLFAWLRERYIARKISDAWDDSSTETMESSSSDTRMARLYSADHKETDSAFRTP